MFHIIGSVITANVFNRLYQLICSDIPNKVAHKLFKTACYVFPASSHHPPNKPFSYTEGRQPIKDSQVSYYNQDDDNLTGSSIKTRTMVFDGENKLNMLLFQCQNEVTVSTHHYWLSVIIGVKAPEDIKVVKWL